MTTVRMAGHAWLAIPRPLRFLIVGGVNTLFGYGAYALLLFAGLHYATAAFLGTIAGVLFNFLTTGGLVFGALSPARLARFVGVYAVTYVVNVGLLAWLTRAGLDAYVAGALLLLPMAVVSYLLMRTFVFGPRAGR